MTDPDELGGSAADRRFREALREGLAAAERESQADAQGQGRGPGQGEGRGPGDGPDGDAPVMPREDESVSAAQKPPRARSEVFMDWAPLVVAVLAIGAVIGLALYGINGGDLGPW
jgi:hypothetical protein